MQITTKKILRNITTFSFIITSMVQANNLKDSGNIEETTSVLNKTSKEAVYSMSTSQLQEEVEKLSLNGGVAFDIGKELILRWSKQTTQRDL